MERVQDSEWKDICFLQAEDGIRDYDVTGVQTCALPICGPDVLTRVRAVGNDMALDPGVGTCGKNGQGVPVGVGLPTLLVDGLTVGGTET